MENPCVRGLGQGAQVFLLSGFRSDGCHRQCCDVPATDLPPPLAHRNPQQAPKHTAAIPAPEVPGRALRVPVALYFAVTTEEDVLMTARQRPQ